MFRKGYARRRARRGHDGGLRVGLCLVLGVLLGAVVPATRVAAAPIVPPAASVHLKVVPHGTTFSITASGKYSQSPSELDVYVQCAPGNCGLPAGKPCASKSETELQTVLSQNEKAAAPETLFHVDLGSGSTAGGGYTETRSWPIKPIGIRPFMGTYWVCAYLLVAHTPDGSPTDPPAAHASTHLSLGGGSNPSPAARPFAISDFRVQFSDQRDNLHAPVPRRVESGKPFWLWFTIRINRSLSVTGAHCDVKLLEGKRLLDTDSFAFPPGGATLHLSPGQSFQINSDKIAIRGSLSKLTLVGQVTIDGMSESKTTWVKLVR